RPRRSPPRWHPCWPIRRSGAPRSRRSPASTPSWRLGARFRAAGRPLSCWKWPVLTNPHLRRRHDRCHGSNLPGHCDRAYVNGLTGLPPLPIPSPRAAITAVHGYVPPDLLTNADLARMVDTTDAWITERTGIKERHILKGEGLGTSHMAAEAVRGLLEKTHTRPEDVDLLICATTTPDLQFPSTANLICDMVGIRSVGSFDVQAACSGFLYSLNIGAQFIANGTAR